MAKKENKNDYTRCVENSNVKDVIDFAHYILGQVKNQQEIRDRWMGIYLSIVGGVATFSTFTLAFFPDIIKLGDLYLILGFIFSFTGILGVFFFLLFLSQRINYKMHFRVLSDIQRIVIKEYLSKSYEEYYPEGPGPFKKRRRGADYYASLIQSIIILACFIVSCLFFSLYLNLNKVEMAVVCCVCAFIVLFILRTLYYYFDHAI